MMRFLQPAIGWWLLAAFVTIVAIKGGVRWRYAVSSVVRLLEASGYRASPLRRLPFVILAVSLACIGLALMQPVLPYSQTDVQSRGLDIVVLLDLSSSMQEEMGLAGERRTKTSTTPVGPTRLDATKAAIKAFVRARRDDRIGLVVFSDNPYVVSPLTFDHDALMRYVDLVDDQILAGEGQTAIGDGLALSNSMLARQSGSSGQGHQVIVLFTDGEYNRGRDPVAVLAESKAAAIRVHVIGVDLGRDTQERPAVRDLMVTVEKNGGKYFNANSERDLAEASRSIDTIEKATLVSRVYVRDVPVYEWFLIPGLVSFALAMALRAVPYFVDQT